MKRLCERCKKPTSVYFHHLCDDCIYAALSRRSFVIEQTSPMHYQDRAKVDAIIGRNDDRLLAEATR